MDWNTLVENDLLWIHENGPGEDWLLGETTLRCWWGSVDYVDQVGIVRLDQIELHILRSQYPQLPQVGANATRLSDGTSWRVIQVAEYDPWIWVVRLDRTIASRSPEETPGQVTGNGETGGAETGTETGTETGSETGTETGTETGGTENGTETGTESGTETETGGNNDGTGTGETEIAADDTP